MTATCKSMARILSKEVLKPYYWQMMVEVSILYSLSDTTSYQRVVMCMWEVNSGPVMAVIHSLQRDLSIDMRRCGFIDISRLWARRWGDNFNFKTALLDPSSQYHALVAVRAELLKYIFSAYSAVHQILLSWREVASPAGRASSKTFLDIGQEVVVVVVIYIPRAAWKAMYSTTSRRVWGCTKLKFKIMSYLIK
jgi:hypothetical protein